MFSKTLKKGFLIILLAILSLTTLTSCDALKGLIGGSTDPQTLAQNAIDSFKDTIVFVDNDKITTSFDLPIAGKKDSFNIPITWTSDNAAIEITDKVDGTIVSTTHKLAKVTRPTAGAGDVIVTLTASFELTYTKSDSTLDTLKLQKTFKFKVLEKRETEIGSIKEIKDAAAKFYFVDNKVSVNARIALECPVEFDGTVTSVLNASDAGQFMVSDGTAGIYVYTGNYTASIGDKVHIKGDITSYYGTLQVGANIEVTASTIADQTITYTEKTIKALHEQSVNGGLFGGQTVELYAKVLFGKYNDNSNDSYWLEDPLTGEQVLVYYKSYNTDEATAFDAFVGKYVTLQAVTYDKYSSYKPYNSRVLVNFSTVEEAQAPTFTDEQKLALAKSTVQGLAGEYVSGAKFTFPVEDNGCTIDWALDTTAPYDATNKTFKVVDVDTKFKATATITIGTLTDTVEIEITVTQPATALTLEQLVALDTATGEKTNNQVYATAYVKAYVHPAGANSGYLVSEDGLAIFGYNLIKDNKVNDASLKFGDLIETTVNLTYYNGLTQIAVVENAAIKLVSSNNPTTLTADKMTIAQAAALVSATDFPFNKYIELTGVVTKPGDYYQIGEATKVGEKDVLVNFYGSASDNDKLAELLDNGKEATVKVFVYGKDNKNASYINVAFTGHEGEYTQASLTDNEKVEKDAEKLENYKAVTADFELPLKGDYETTISWAVKDAAGVVELNADGKTLKVTRASETKVATLTATISLGTVQTTKDVTVEVSKISTGEQKYVYDFVKNFSTYAADWSKSYGVRTISSTDLGTGLFAASFELSNGSKQPSTITDRPVGASKSSNEQYVTANVNNGNVKAVSFTLQQWTTKKFTKVVIQYLDGTTWKDLTTTNGISSSSQINSAASGLTTFSATLPTTGDFSSVRICVLGSTTGNNQFGLTDCSLTIVEKSAK